MSVAGIKEDRPSYVQFEVRAVEDRAATIEQGHYVSKDVHYAIITPQGSKDRIMRVVSEWFDQMKQQVSEDRMPRMWLEKYKEAYEYWKKGIEIPINGTSVRNWPFPSPSQVQLLIDLHLLTIEDVAEANEEAVHRLGMGGIGLKQAAQIFLSKSKGDGQDIRKMDALQAENEALKIRGDSLEKQVQELAEQVRALAPRPAQEMRTL
jgi:hypothetical protein